MGEFEDIDFSDMPDIDMDAMDKLHGEAADFTKMTQSVTSYSWNIFRYFGDYIHVASIAILLYTILNSKSCRGFSQKTMVITLVAFISRYLDLFDHAQSAYLVIFKLGYIVSFSVVNYLFVVWNHTVDVEKDTCSLFACIAPAAIGALLLTDRYSVLEVLWTFSEFLEGFAMVPQYVFLYRDNCKSDIGVAMFVLACGLYRIFYALNWIYKKAMMPHYSDMQSWMGGILEIGFFLDFLNGKFRGNSILAQTVLAVDDNVNKVVEKVEDKIGISRVINKGNLTQVRKRKGAGGMENEFDMGDTELCDV